jgi:hypothetical protein
MTQSISTDLIKKGTLPISIILILLPLIFLTGCTSTTPPPPKTPDVILDNLTHEETLGTQDNYLSNIYLYLKNTGGSVATNVDIHVVVTDNFNYTEYDNVTFVKSALFPDEGTTVEIICPYNLQDAYLALRITIQWDNGSNLFSRTIFPLIENPDLTPDVFLQNISHKETQNSSGYSSTITFLLLNDGDFEAKNIQINVTVYDPDGNEKFADQVPVVSLLIPDDSATSQIIVPYDSDDTSLNIEITVLWDGGFNQYTKTIVLSLH